MRTARSRPIRSGAFPSLSILLALGIAACGEPTGPKVRFVVPDGATVPAVADTLAAHDVIGWPSLFRLYVRVKGVGSEIKAGTYELPEGSGWSRALNALVEGRVLTLPVTIPEGWTLGQIAERIAPIAELSADSATRRLFDTRLADSLGVPGPSLEGYLFPETYRFAQGVSLESIAARMVARYDSVWTPQRRLALDSLRLNERELVTLASIIQSEARWRDEMPAISAVFHNRLRRGMRLQADPTVQYALESRQGRLLFRHIEEVADNPYNTYTHSGLPPGPIGSPGAAAIDAALHPADLPYLYFVARDDGHHEFSSTLREHNRKIRSIRGVSNPSR